MLAVQANQGGLATGMAAVGSTADSNAYAALLKQQVRPGQPGGLSTGAGQDGFSIANETDFPALTAAATAPQRNESDARAGYIGLGGQGAGGVMGGRPGFPGVLGGDPFGGQVTDFEQLLRMQQQQQQQARLNGATTMQGGKLPGQSNSLLGAQLLGPGGQAGEASSMKGGPAGMGGMGGQQPPAPSGPPIDKWGFLAIMPLLKMADPDATM